MVKGEREREEGR
jgi:hypothetical protein